MSHRHLRLHSRRDVFRFGVGATAAAAIPSGTAACNSSPAPQAGFFTDDERKALGALANAIIPPDDTPGATDLGVIPYIEQLLTAFDSADATHSPAIYPGGPFSGRAPYADAYGVPSTNFPPNAFSSFLFLDRVKDAGWRLALFGSTVVPMPNAKLLPAITGMRAQMKAGLADAITNAPAPLDQMSQPDVMAYFNKLEPNFKHLLVDLVSQGCFCAPEYGGNVGLKGWLLTHFPGDQLPLGYSVWSTALNRYVERPDAPMTTATVSDPEPLDTDVIDIINKIVPILGGKTFQ